MSELPITSDAIVRHECLKLAVQAASAHDASATIVESAGMFYDFVAGTDRAALANEAKAAIDRAVR